MKQQLFHVCFVSSVAAHSSATLLDSLREMIGNSQLGPPLHELRRLYSAGMQYLMDFVHMVYKPSSDVEHEVSFLPVFSSQYKIPLENSYVFFRSACLGKKSFIDVSYQKRCKYTEYVTIQEGK